MMYRVLRKRLSDLTKGFVVVEEDIEADNAVMNNSGGLVLVAYPEDKASYNVALIPAGAWMECDRLDKDSQQQQSTLIQP
jgi:hypothetical protein